MHRRWRLEDRSLIACLGLNECLPWFLQHLQLSETDQAATWTEVSSQNGTVEDVREHREHRLDPIVEFPRHRRVGMSHDHATWPALALLLLFNTMTAR